MGWRCLKSESRVRRASCGGLKLSIAVGGRFDLTVEEKAIREGLGFFFFCSVLLFYDFLLNLEQEPYKKAGNLMCVYCREGEVNRLVGAFYVISLNKVRWRGEGDSG